MHIQDFPEVFNRYIGECFVAENTCVVHKDIYTTVVLHSSTDYRRGAFLRRNRICICAGFAAQFAYFINDCLRGCSTACSIDSATKVIYNNSCATPGEFNGVRTPKPTACTCYYHDLCCKRRVIEGRTHDASVLLFLRMRLQE